MNDQPKHKYVDGVLVELTQAEIDAIMRERGDAELKNDQSPPIQPEPDHGKRRTKRS